MPQQTLYTARFAYPDALVRGQAQTIECPVYRNGALVAPTSGTVSVFDAGGTAIVNEAAVTVTSSIAVYAITAATLPSTLALSDAWTIRWTLLIASKTYTFRQSAALVRHDLWPVVTDLDLTSTHSELADWYSTGSTLQSVIDESWKSINLRVWEAGKRPWLVLNPTAFRGVHRSLALSEAFRNASVSTSGAGKYQELADHYMKQYELAWERLSLQYDYDDDEIQDDGYTGASPVVMLSQPGDWYCDD